MPSDKSDLAAAETLASDATAPPSAVEPAPAPVAADAFPVEKWDRYDLVEPIGRGGMGTVYKARDRRLNRTVALKFILGANPNLVLRFLQEARAQARIDHPNVCHVYEVGEVDGRAYIAMQFVDGEQLGKVAPRLSLEQKVAVMRDVALAIHEAHKLGIVHRDLKPSNIMVERGDDGRWFPVVMDFGLAREATTEVGLTESGALLGTPAYMAPEQARGDWRAVDRRADVYSLGATLFELLTGQPPFPHTALALALERVLHSEPPAPRSLVSTVPIDLETIALKCLEKEPDRRYASARGLADDLSRYLDGEPVLARRPSLWYRLRLRARRNRALVTVSAVSLVAVLTAAAFGVRTLVASRRERASAVERARLAESLGRDAKQNEWLLRAAYELPLHDTSGERELIRANMRRIVATRHDLGARGDAAIHDALGRGYLALHEWSEAARELDRAAAAGLDTAGLHAARGRVLGELYHRALEEARRSGDRAWLAGRQKELERQYLAPALVELEKSRADGDSAGDGAVLQALVALYRRDFAAARERAAEAIARAPWLFEAGKIAADATYQAALEELDHGRYAAAAAGFARSVEAYDAAATVARSDASIYEAAAQAWLQRAEVDFRLGRTPKEAIEHALAATDAALVADPRDATALKTRAYVLMLQYRTPSLRPADVRELLERIAQAASRSVAIDPREAAAWDALGNAHFYRGGYELRHGGDPTTWWKDALTELQRALQIRPNDPWANNDLGVVHRWIGNHLEDAGKDPMAEYEAALRSEERATAVDPQYVIGFSNQIDVAATVANYQASRGTDPGAAVERARRAAERCLVIDPNYFTALDNMALVESALAEYLSDAGRDPMPALAAAHAYGDRSLALHGDFGETRLVRASTSVLEARYLVRRGADASRAIAAARAELAVALRLVSGCADCFAQAATLDLLEGNPDRALADARKAVAIDKQFAAALAVAARACLQLSSLRDGLAYADAALAVNANNAEAHAIKAALLKRSGQAEAARAEAGRAFAINPLLRREWGKLE
ncbi:MAG: Serine/threonine protein kinase [Myxococcales bacterium]|nr:Serine/threonine protein kinase [Myxococcales bacterium]